MENRTNNSVSKSDGNTLEGYAILWDVRSSPINEFGRRFTETISKGAFRNLNSNDIKLYYNHDKSMPLARTQNGTLTLTEDEKGLKFRAELPNTTLGNDVRELLRVGTLTGEMSFGFIATREKWNEKKDQRTVTEADLYEISVVQDAAYPQTSSQLRKQLLQEITNKRINDIRRRHK